MSTRAKEAQQGTNTHTDYRWTVVKSSCDPLQFAYQLHIGLRYHISGLKHDKTEECVLVVWRQFLPTVTD